ncbi:hypothetical protein KZX50_19880 [Bacillus infantis]|uniref:hypothetical protein n=1 Tax=Bacillus infantis TaxID=324767 RepID=UPI00200546CC|nr:hypothetical protein [Bacillus infantis]MCK6207705.1 hypothetical protein [Bacillus infantis]
MDIIKLVEEAYEKKKQKDPTEDEPPIKLNDSVQLKDEIAEHNKALKIDTDTPQSDTKSIVKAIVDRLNSGETFSLVEKEFRMNKTAIRVLLRNNGYNYNHLFNIWTSLSEYALLEVLRVNLKDSQFSLHEYAKRNKLNYKTLQQKLSQFEKQNDVQNFSQDKTTSENSALDQKKVNPSSMSRQLESYFSVDDLLVLKSIVSERKSYSNTLVEVPLFLENDTFRKLIKYSAEENQSISDIIKKWVEEKIKEPN